jgi:hypothetical protein
MQLKILDQVHLSGVRASTLAAGEIVEVSKDLGAELLEKHPDKFEAVGEAGVDQAGVDQAPAGKAEAPPQNKAETAPANKAGKPARRKRGK